MSPNQFIIRSNGGENQFGCKTFEYFNPTGFNLVKVKGEAELGMKPITLEKECFAKKVLICIDCRHVETVETAETVETVETVDCRL